MAIETGRLGIQQIRRVEDRKTGEVKGQEQPLKVVNPGAGKYAGQGTMSTQSGSASIASPADDVNQKALDDKILEVSQKDAQLDYQIKEITRVNTNLEAYLASGKLDATKAAAVRKAVVDGKALLAKVQLDSQKTKAAVAMFQNGTLNDWDGDGLSNESEIKRGTNPWSNDTDSDGLSDEVEQLAQSLGLGVDPTKFDGDGDGVGDYNQYHREITDIATKYGIENPFTQQSAKSGSSSSPLFGGGTQPATPPATTPGTTPAATPAATPPMPGSDAVVVKAGAQSVGAQSAKMGAQTAGGTMSAQTIGGDVILAVDQSLIKAVLKDAVPVPPPPPPPDPTTKEGIAYALKNQKDLKERTITPTAKDASGINFKDVIVEVGDKTLLEQVGNDYYIYTKGEKIIIKNGVSLKIFIKGTMGSDTFIFQNVDRQNIQGTTTLVNGTSTWKTGIFLPTTGISYGSSGNQVKSQGAMTAQAATYTPYSYKKASSPDTTTPPDTSIENVYTNWDISKGNSWVTRDGATTMETTGSVTYPVETFSIKNGIGKADISLQPDVTGTLVAGYKLTGSGNDLVIEYLGTSGTTIQKTILKDFKLYGKDLNFIIPNVPKDPLGTAMANKSAGKLDLKGHKFDASEVDTGFGLNITAGDGDDWIIGTKYGDKIDGGIGNDLIDAGDGDNIVNGGAGFDTIKGGTGKDTISGGADDDVIDGGSGINVLDGGAGNDLLVTTGSGSTIIGGSGYDLTNVARSLATGTTIVEAVDGSVTIYDGKTGEKKLTKDQYSAWLVQNPASKDTGRTRVVESSGGGATIYSGDTTSGTMMTPGEYTAWKAMRSPDTIGQDVENALDEFTKAGSGITELLKSLNLSAADYKGAFNMIKSYVEKNEIDKAAQYIADLAQKYYQTREGVMQGGSGALGWSDIPSDGTKPPADKTKPTT